MKMCSQIIDDIYNENDHPVKLLFSQVADNKSWFGVGGPLLLAAIRSWLRAPFDPCLSRVTKVG